MNNSYLARAKKIIEDPKTLAIVVSKRARQLAMGARPMVRCNSAEHLDIALLEIAEHKLSFDPYTGGAIEVEEEEEAVLQ
jgi:DNA-directed RNA polymerase subunit K/omega